MNSLYDAGALVVSRYRLNDRHPSYEKQLLSRQKIVPFQEESRDFRRNLSEILPKYVKTFVGLVTKKSLTDTLLGV